MNYHFEKHKVTGAPVLSTLVLPDGNQVRNGYFISDVKPVLESDVVENGLTKGRPFDVMAPGTFRPGNLFGAEITFPAEDMEAYLANTLKVIKATEDEDGIVLGLTIDSYGHVHGSGAAGWLVDVWLEEYEGMQVMRGQPMWTARGVELVGGGLFKWYSGEFDMIEKVMLGGSLTNWPATRQDSGEMIMRPVLLSREIAYLGDDDPLEGESLEDKARRIRDAFWLISEMWVEDVFDDHVIASADGKLWQVNFAWSEEEKLIFNNREEWIEVKQTYVEAGHGGMLPQWFTNLFSNKLLGDGQEASLETQSGVDSGQTNPTDKGEKIMPPKNGTNDPKSTPEKDAAALASLEAYFPRGEDESDENYQIRIESLSQISSAVLESDFSDMDTANQAVIDAEVARLESTRTREIQLATERIRMVNEVEGVAFELSGGTSDIAKGLPVDSKRLATFLLSLNANQRKEAIFILQETVGSGLVDYVEDGSEETTVPVEEFPPKMRPYLLSWVKGENDIEDFFIENSDVLLSSDKYDLAFVEKFIGGK